MDHTVSTPAAVVTASVTAVVGALTVGFLVWAVCDTVIKLRHNRRMAKAPAPTARERAAASGHPSAGRRDSETRAALARALAAHLTRSGMRLYTDLTDRCTVVRVWGEDGLYVIDSGPRALIVRYETNHGLTEPVPYARPVDAATAILQHYNGVAA